MGVLKARVSGAWVDVGLGGGPLNAGGVLGDILVKQSATNSDAVWTTQMPKLHVTSTTVATMDTTNPALSIGNLNGSNVAHYQTGMQARNNGATSPLNINPYGGQITIGALDSSQYPPGLYISESSHATSRRAQMNIGSSWQIGQDFGGNGTKDFFIYSIALAQRVFAASNTGDRVEVGDVSSIVKLAKGSGGRVLIGDDAELRDINSAHALAIVSQTDGNKGYLHFGNVGASGPFIATANNAYLHLRAASDIYLDGNNTYFRNAAGADKANFNSSGHLTLPSLTASGTVQGATVTSTGAMYASNWFRTYGNGGIYSESYVCGLQFPATGWISLYACTGFAMENGILRLRAVGDGNHVLQYYNGTPPGSGEANNGPLLAGYSSVWLHNNAYNKPLYLASSGNVFIATGQSYTTMSSLENKDNIVPIDPEECLDQVNRWRPVEFDCKDDGHHAEGFIAEEHVEVTPSMVNVCGPDSLRPGWANAINYAGGTVRLAGAVQALLRRIEQLEEKVA